MNNNIISENTINSQNIFLESYNTFNLTNDFYLLDNMIDPCSIKEFQLSENGNEFQLNDKKKENYLIKDDSKLSELNNPNEIIIKDIHCNNQNKITKKNKFLCRQINKELPPHYLYNTIKDKIFPKLNIRNEIKESFIYNEKIINLENAMSDSTYYSKKRRNRGLLKTKEKTKKLLGRKKKDDHSNSIHNKESQDNIIKKIKSKLFYYLLNSINDLLNSLLNNNIKKFTINKNKKEENEKILKKIAYKKIIDDTKRENNLLFLKMPLKEIFSNNISSKYRITNKNLNKNRIEALLTKKKDNEIIMFVLNMTFGDWFDIFIYKKELKDFKILNNEQIKIISDKFPKIENLFEEIYDLNFGKDYFSYFVYLIYNYERWFFIKQGRQRKYNKKKD